MNKRRTVNVNDAREILGCSRQHVYNLFHKGRIDGFMNGEGRGLRLYHDSIMDYIGNQIEIY